MVTFLRFVGDDQALIQALRAGHPGAAAAFYDRHAPHVYRTLRSVLGPDADLPDLMQEVFLRALDRIGDLADPERARSWITTISIFVARAHIRRRTRRKWLGLFSPEQTRARHADPPAAEAQAALRLVYQLLDRMPTSERLAFVLRIVQGLTLSDAAAACRVSLATFKRRLARAERRFVAEARQQPALIEWLEEGTRWNLRQQS